MRLPPSGAPAAGRRDAGAGAAHQGRPPSHATRHRSAVAAYQWCHIAHIFGFDFIIDASGKVVLLEVNSYPAIGNGSMSAVDPSLFSALLRDIFHLAVFPVLDGAEPKPGDFLPLPL